MLVLSRYRDESIMIRVNEWIEIKVLKIRRDRVKLGISSNSKIPIRRAGHSQSQKSQSYAIEPIIDY